MPDRRAADALRSQILSFLENHPDRAYRAKEISRALQIKNQGRYQALLEAFDSIRDSGDAAGIRGGRLQHRGNESEAVGRLSVTAQGFGFVEAEDGTEYFIRARRMRTALDGDRVRIALAADTRNRPSDMKREAEVIEVIERGRQRTVGTFSVTGKSGWVAPDDNRLTHDVFVPRDGWNGATSGDKVVVTIDVFDDPRASPEGTIVDVLGPADAPGVDVLALAMAHGAP
ncbi:MAG: ribonuclease R, partial [Bacteroidota bacterium]